MSTVIRTEVSERNPYHIDKNRYLELKYFCLQYPSWKTLYLSYSSLCQGTSDAIGRTQKEFQNPVENCVEKREFYYDRIMLLQRTALETDPVIGNYILEGVVSGISYDALNARDKIPCCRQVYYELYRKFFWLLDKNRG